MRRSIWLYLVPLVFVTSRAQATAVSPPGVNLRWDNCYGDGGVWNKNFACDTNFGSERLVGSFELADALPQASGTEVYLDLSAQSAQLPLWWTFKNFGTCRQSSLAVVSAPPTGSVSCLDWTLGQGAGGLGAYNVGAHGAQTARIILGVAVTQNNLADLSPGQEYFFLDRGANFSGSQWVTWQNGYPINIQRHCESNDLFCSGHYNSFDCVLATPTRSHGSTWGLVKSLYR